MMLDGFKSLAKDYWRITIKQFKRYWLFGALLIIYLLFFHFILHDHPNCLIKLVFGFPCPGCGLTRSFLALARFDIKEAFRFHPLFWLVLLVVFVFVYAERPWINKISKNKIIIILVGLTFIVTYILRMIYIFPKVPMDPYYKALISKIFLVKL